jgi:Zn-dependent protease
VIPVAASPACPACGTENPPHLLSCPGCHRLVHATRLSQLAQQATAAEQTGDISLALSHWREALDLLPGDTAQHATILARVTQLSQGLDSANPAVAPPPHKAKSAMGKTLTGLGAFGLLLWKLKVVLIFALTKGKLLLLGLTKASTFLSMFGFFAAYWSIWGWPFALGLVISIYIHEMGHVDALRRYGFKATAPMFIPGFGALIRLQQHPTRPSENARIGLAGPMWGAGAAVLAALIYYVTGRPFWAGICHLAAWINLFNLIPISPLDGGRGFDPLSRTQALLLCAIVGAAWFVTGESLLLIIGIAAIIRALAKPADAQSDGTAFVMFILLITALSALVCLRGPHVL